MKPFSTRNIDTWRMDRALHATLCLACLWFAACTCDAPPDSSATPPDSPTPSDSDEQPSPTRSCEPDKTWQDVTPYPESTHSADEGNELRGEIYLNEVATVFVGNPGEAFAETSTLQGDLDRDGRADVVVAAWRNSANGELSGAIYIYLSSDIDNHASGIPIVTSMASIVIRGESAGDKFGGSIAIVKSMAADGGDALVVGAIGSDWGGLDAGAVFLFLDPTLWIAGSSDLDASEADLILTGEKADLVGHVASVGDIDADGINDFTVMKPYSGFDASPSGTVYLVRSSEIQSLTGLQPLETSSTHVMPSGIGHESSTGFKLGDVNQDGIDDLGVRRYVSSPGTPSGGEVVIFQGPISQRVLFESDATWRIRGQFYGGFPCEADECPYHSEGFAAAAIGDVDLDGDGFLDVMISAPSSDLDAPSGGAVYIFPEPSLAESHISCDASAVISSTDTSEYIGLRIAANGDLNGDGWQDLAITGDGRDWNYFGAVYVFYGPLPLNPGRKSLQVSSADIILVGSRSETSNGLSYGDVDGDGKDELLVAEYLPFDSEQIGMAYLIFGR